MNANDDRRREVEAWWALISKVLAFFLGFLLVGYEAAFGSADNPSVRVILVVAGIAMMGPVIAASTTSMMAALRGRDEQ